MDAGTTNTKITVRHLYFSEGLLAIGWFIYWMAFYSFYTEAYFYVDKRLSLFLQLLSLFKSNWDQLLFYLILGFLLFALTLFVVNIFYVLNKDKPENKQSLIFFLTLTILSLVPLFFNICWIVFLILLILAASLVYVIFILGTASQEGTKNYEEGETIEIKGPFETEEAAQKAVTLFLKEWQAKETIILGKEIYVDTDQKYYVDIFIESLKK